MSAEDNLKGTAELEALYSQLRLSISHPRVERRAGRSHGIWIAEKSLVQVKRKEGKFEHFGHHIANKLYLEYYEALYLLELGRLQLDKDGVSLSIEQAYLLLLGEEHSPKFNEYLVYSYLTRAGYILMRHRNLFFSQTFMQAPTEIDCIWAWLSNAVERRTVPSYIKKSEMFAKVKQQIEDTKQGIMRQEAIKAANVDLEIDVGTPTKKPKLAENEEASEPKNQAPTESADFWPTVKESSFIEFLMSENEFKQFEKTFQKFDVIKLRTSRSLRNDVNNDDSDSDDHGLDIVCDLNHNFVINFDLHLHNNGFKKSLPIPPVMRVLVLDSKQSFPNHTEISRCCQHLFFTTPLLIVSVGDAKQIQAFLYLFT